MAKLVRPLIGDMEVQTSFVRDVGTIYADPGELQQVLLNCVSTPATPCPTAENCS